MAKPDQISDEKLRGQIEKAHGQMRSGDPSGAVRTLADAFIYMMEKKPEMLEANVVAVAGRQIPMVMRWPALGANLSLESVLAKEPKIEFQRERFSVSEAITYYEFTLDSAIAQAF
jgi:hypothetical protein